MQEGGCDLADRADPVSLESHLYGKLVCGLIYKLIPVVMSGWKWSGM